MAYDWTTEIQFLTREDNLPASVINWAVRHAKTYYVAGDPSTYDEDLSDVDNQLVSFLASAFALVYIESLELPAAFKLDEFSIEEQKQELNSRLSGVLNRYFDMFFSWKLFYDIRGIALQFADEGSLLAVTTFTTADLIADLTLPDGLEQ